MSAAPRLASRPGPIPDGAGRKGSVPERLSRRVALVSEHASPLTRLGGVDSGGQNVYVGQLARHLATMGYRVDVFTRCDSDLLPEVAEWVPGVRIVHVPAGPPAWVRKEDLLPYMDDFADYVIRFARRRSRPYHVLHANFWMSALVASRVKDALGIPFVVTFHALGRIRRLHQGEADESPPERLGIEDAIVAHADHVIAECPQEQEDLVRLYNADPSRVTIVPAGFDPSELWPISKPLARVALGLPHDERVILQLGRMVRRKGVDTAIQGFSRLVHDHGIDARMIVVGGEADEPDPELTPELGRLAELARQEGVAGKVTFAGRKGRDDLKYYYSAADIFTTVPWYEPFGITPLEAMACGTPVVGSNVGGIKFSVRDGETGYLVAPNDPVALAERMAHLYRHPKLLALFGRQAIGRANALFTWQQVAASVAAVYEQVVAGRPGNSAEARSLAVVDRGFTQAVRAMQQSHARLRHLVLAAAEELLACFDRGGKVLVCGNGGSAADAQHLAGELVGRFRRPDRPALPALALTADSAVLTGWANDEGYEKAFARQIEAFGRPGDVLIGISTSGRSQNVLAAFRAARELSMRCIGILGGDGGAAAPVCDVPILAASDDTQRIQEVHTLVIHLMCELVEAGVMEAFDEEAEAPRTLGG